MHYVLLAFYLLVSSVLAGDYLSKTADSFFSAVEDQRRLGTLHSTRAANQNLNWFSHANTILGHIRSFNPNLTTLVLDIDDTVLRNGNVAITENGLASALKAFQQAGGNLLFATYRSAKYHQHTIAQLQALSIVPSPLLSGQQIIVDPQDSERKYVDGILYCNQSHVFQGGKYLKGYWLNKLFARMPEQKSRYIAFFDDMGGTVVDVYLQLAKAGYKVQSYYLSPIKVGDISLPWWAKREIMMAQNSEPVPGEKTRAVKMMLQKEISLRMRFDPNKIQKDKLLKVAKKKRIIKKSPQKKKTATKKPSTKKIIIKVAYKKKVVKKKIVKILPKKNLLKKLEQPKKKTAKASPQQK